MATTNNSAVAFIKSKLSILATAITISGFILSAHQYVVGMEHRIIEGQKRAARHAREEFLRDSILAFGFQIKITQSQKMLQQYYSQELQKLQAEDAKDSSDD